MHRVTWVFGYGSLMWQPGFHPVEMVKGQITGFARRFCLRSITYRGTRESPGLVLGLDAEPAAECHGVALRIDDQEYDDVIAYLRARELDTGAYEERILPVALEDGRKVEALAYVMQPDHWQYAGGLNTSEQALIIAHSRGKNGLNADYLFNTAQHLTEMGIADILMDQLSDEVRRLLEKND